MSGLSEEILQTIVPAWAKVGLVMLPVASAMLAGFIVQNKERIKKAFEVKEMTEQEVIEYMEESAQGELINRREGLEQ